MLPTTPAPVGTGACTVTVQGSNPYWAGLYIGFESSSAILDFAATGIDLGMVTVQGVFGTSISGNLLTLTNPGWETLANPGYLGFHPSSGAYEPLVSLGTPVCTPV